MRLTAVGTPTNGAAPNVVTFNAPSAYTNSGSTYSALTCNGDANRQLSCTRFASKTPGSFCANDATSGAALGFGTTCTMYPTVPLFLADA